MYILTYHIIVNEKSLIQKIFIDEGVVIVSVNNNWSIYIKSQNEFYTVKTDSRELVIVNNKNIKEQVSNISNEMGTINVLKEEKCKLKYGLKTFSYIYGNELEFPKVKSEIQVSILPELVNTCYLSYMLHEKQNMLLNLNLIEGEIMVYNKTEINFKEASYTQLIDLISIDIECFTENLLSFKNFKIKK